VAYWTWSQPQNSELSPTWPCTPVNHDNTNKAEQFILDNCHVSVHDSLQWVNVGVKQCRDNHSQAPLLLKSEHTVSSSDAGSNTNHPEIQCNLYPSFSNASFFFSDIVHFFWYHSHLYKQCTILPDSLFLCTSFYSSFWILSPHPQYSHNDHFWGET